MAVAHGMGEGAAAEVCVATEIGGDHIHTELERFCHAAPEAFRAVQGEEHVAAAVEGEELIALYGWPPRGGCADLPRRAVAASAIRRSQPGAGSF